MIGVRHNDGCNCGCRFVAGLPGRVQVNTPDAESLREAGLVIVDFTVPCPAGGPSREKQIAYSLEEAGLVA